MKVILIMSLMSSFAFAKTVGRVLELNGSAFIYDKSNKVSELSYAQKIPASSKVMLEDNANAIVVTEDGTKYFITAGSFVKFYEDGIELNNGKIWVHVGSNSKHKLIQTPNLKSNHEKGQYVYSFNPSTERSDVLNVYGECEVSSLLDKNKKIKVFAGQFSTLDIKKNDGYPREATRVGMKSYESIKMSFSSFKELQNLKMDKTLESHEKESSRAIASVKKESLKKGTVSFVKYDYKAGSRKIASVAKKVKTKKSHKTAKVRFFSLSSPSKIKKYRSVPSSSYKSTKKIAKRLPSSIGGNSYNSSTVNLFEQSLRKNIKEIPKHSSEVNQLIDELKSYKEDFTKEY